MKMFKKVFAVVLCLAMVLSFSALTVSADDAKTVVDGIRWFPADADRQNDDIWEAECVQQDCLCQGFLMTEAETGYNNFLDTEYGEDGSLTITRNGNDGNEVYWPRIRTVMLDNYPELDWSVADTLYFDITASEGTKWNVYVSVNGVTIKLGRAMAEACGVAVEGDFGNSEDDASSGSYVGTLNLTEALETIANDGSANAPNALAIQKMKTTFVPQVQIFCVGGVGASVTINKLYMTTADDVNGDKCDHLDMGLVYGDEIYDILDEEVNEPVVDEPDVDTDPSEDETEETDPTTKATEATTTTTAAAEEEEGGLPIGLIIGIVAAVVVVAVVVIVVVKKKNA